MSNQFPAFGARLRSLGKSPEDVRRRMREAQLARHNKTVRRVNRYRWTTNGELL